MEKAYDPMGFLELADRLLYDEAYEKDSRARTAAGRFYYAVFLLAWHKLREKGVQVPESSEIHQVVIGKYNEKGLSSIGNRLDQLRESARAQKNDLTVEKLMKHFSMPRCLGSRSNFESTAYSVVITPSPRTIDEYAEKIGKIVEDRVNAWSDPSFDMLKIVAKGKTIWEDKLQVRDKALTRKEVLKISLVDGISFARFNRKQAITEVEEKFMQEDENLKRLFSKQEIDEIAQKVKDLILRATKFYGLIARGFSGAKIRKDPEWFTRNEIIYFKLADDVDYAVPRN